MGEHDRGQRTAPQIRRVVRNTLRGWPEESLEVNLRTALEAEFRRQGYDPTAEQMAEALRLANSPLRRLRTAGRLIRRLIREVHATARSTPRWMEPPRSAVNLDLDDLDEYAVRFSRVDLAAPVVARIWQRFEPVLNAEDDIVAMSVWTDPADAKYCRQLLVGKLEFAPVSPKLLERLKSTARKHTATGKIQFDAELRFRHGDREDYQLTVWIDA